MARNGAAHRPHPEAGRRPLKDVPACTNGRASRPVRASAALPEPVCRASAAAAGWDVVESLRGASNSMGVDTARGSGRVRLQPPALEGTMDKTVDLVEASTAIRVDIGAIFVSMELSRKTCEPGGGGQDLAADFAFAGRREKMSRHSLPAGDLHGLLEPPGDLRRKALARDGVELPDHRHSGSGAGRVLDPPGAGARGDGEPCRRSRFRTNPRKRSGGPTDKAAQDRQDRRAGAVAGSDGLKRRAPRVCAMAGPPSRQDAACEVGPAGKAAFSQRLGPVSSKIKASLNPLPRMRTT